MKAIRIVLLVMCVYSLGAQSLSEMQYFVDREMFAKGKAVVQQLIKKDPANADYYFYLGDIDFKNDKSDSAKYWFMEGIKKNEKCALCYVGMGKVTSDSNPTEGKANFDKAISLASKDARIYAAIGDYWINLDKPDGKKGIEVLTKATELDKTNLNYKMMLGDAYRLSLDASKGMALYKEALAKDTMSPLPYWRIGKLYLGAKNYELGKQYFNQGLAKDPNFSLMYREFGELYYRWKKYDKAIENYKKYVELRDKSDDTDYRYASFQFLSKNYKEALDILSGLQAKGYKNPVLYRLLAYAYYETKDYTTAAKNMEIFWQKIEEKKIIASDYEYQGKIYLRNGKDSLAVKNIQKAVEMDSTKKDTYKEVAEYYNEKGNYASSKLFYKKITTSGRASGNDYYALGKVCMNLKDYNAADSAFAKVIELRPELHQGYLWRARANGNLDPESDKALAKPYYEKYIEVAKADSQKNKDGLVEAYSYLGSYYMLNTKDKAQAQAAWNNVKILDPANKAVVEADKYLKTMK